MDDKKVLYITIGMLIVSLLMIVGLTIGVKREIANVNHRIEELQSMKASAETSEVDEADGEEVIENPVVKNSSVENTVSAVEVCKEVVLIHDILGDLYCSDGYLPKELVEMRLEEGPNIGKRLNELTGIDADMYPYAAWKLHQDWSLELTSTMEYDGIEEFPVLFTMRTESGELAGVVRAKYNVDKGSLSDVEPYYPGMDYFNLTKDLGDL